MLKPLHKEEGITPGEKELNRLADASFFGLWSYASVQREVTEGGRTFSQEVTDLIVVFGKEVILFSEKDIQFQEIDDISLAWKRWFGKSVEKSVDQLRGAERKIKSGQYRLFLDAARTQPFPFDLTAPDLRVHLVAICRNSFKAAKRHFAKFELPDATESSTGSLAFASPMRTENMLANPFWIGDFDPGKTFVHVFDEQSVKLLLTELDTAADFINYLTVRERAIRKGQVSLIYGEEDFLAVYLASMGKNGFGDFVPTAPMPENAIPSIEEGMWITFRQTVLYEIHLELRKTSEVWKRLAHDFAHGVITATVGEASEESLEIHERAVRAMASENLASRAALGHALIEKHNAVPSQRRSSRIIPSLSNPDRLYIFVFIPMQQSHASYEDYRLERRAYMNMYANAAQLKFPGYSEIVVLGADTKGSVITSETLLVVEGSPQMSEETKAEIQKMMEEHKVLTDLASPRPATYRPTITDLGSFEESMRPRSKPPGPNKLCFCGSGKKYKKCCRP